MQNKTAFFKCLKKNCILLKKKLTVMEGEILWGYLKITTT